jgi:hypothetical protein
VCDRIPLGLLGSPACASKSARASRKFSGERRRLASSDGSIVINIPFGFELDGLKILRGRSLKDAREIVSLPSDTSQAATWTPRAALRLGMLLRDSEVAKKVPTLLLDITEVAPVKQEEMSV